MCAGTGQKAWGVEKLLCKKLLSETTLVKGTKKLFKAKSKPCEEQENGVDCLLYSLMYIEFESMGIAVTNEDPTKGFLVGTSGYLTADMYQIRELAVLSMLQCSLITDTFQHKFNEATKSTMLNLCAVLNSKKDLSEHIKWLEKSWGNKEGEGTNMVDLTEDLTAGAHEIPAVGVGMLADNTCKEKGKGNDLALLAETAMLALKTPTTQRGRG